jgi:hypothetical protein
MIYEKNLSKKSCNIVPLTTFQKGRRAFKIELRENPIKGTVSQVFLLQIFLMNHLPPSP